MRTYIFIFTLFLVLPYSCLTIEAKPELIHNYKLTNHDFYTSIVKINSGATSPNFIQIRRIYADGTHEVINNIENRDSIVHFECAADSVMLVVRGRLNAEYFKSDTFKFSINDTWTPGRFRD
jgi:hypothetical protein